MRLFLLSVYVFLQGIVLKHYQALVWGNSAFGLTTVGAFVLVGMMALPEMSKSLIITKDEYMMKKLEPITPGEVLLEEFLKPMGITQSQFAKDLKVPANRISQIIHGKREITADTALRLGKYFGIEPEFWLNLQSHYSMKIAINSFGDEIDKEVQTHKITSSVVFA